ncbi:MAG: hypothetical protein IPH69_08960 [Bacteroidales bacterium]|nr:hypothetical protein [Bacteroidales bacterium]
MKFSKLIQIWLILAGFVNPVCLYAQPDSSNVLSQFLFKDFSKGIVQFKNGTVTSALMNYNTISGKMVFEKSGKYLDLINTETIDTVYLQNRKFVPFEELFLEVVTGSPIRFFIQHKGDLMSPGKQAAYGGTSQTTSSTSYSTVFTDSKAYNINLPEGYRVDKSTVNWVFVYGKMEKFLNEKQFLRIFKSREAELKKYIRENRINFKNRSDLLKLLYFCNEI